MAGMNWNKARKFREREEKYGEGTRLDNGRRIYTGPRDSLDARAKMEEQRWLKQLKQKK